MVKKKYHDIRIYNGEVFDLAFKVLDTEDQVVDLTGAAVTAQLREYPQHDEPPFDFEVRHNHSGGRITITMTAEHTALIGYPYGTYDVYVTFPDGHVECVLWGKAFIISDVSRVQGGTQQIILAFMSFDDFPEIGNLYRLYLDCDEGNLYRWTGTQYVNALEGLRGLPGEDGVGILEIRKVHTTPDGLTDTYEIEYTNGETWLYYVHNGNGIVSIQKIGTSGVIDTYRISMQNGTHSDFTVRNGKGITSIYKIGTEGLVDTYRIAFNDSSIMDFTVTNGHDGHDGQGSIVVVRNREAYVSLLSTVPFSSIIGLPSDNTALAAALATKSDTTHTHDDRYYTEAEIDAMLADTGWTAMTNGSVYSGTIWYRKKAGLVHLVIDQIFMENDLTSSGWTSLFVLPSGYRPTKLQFSAIHQRNQEKQCVLFVNTTGVVSIAAVKDTVPNTARIYTSFSFPV